VDDEVWTDTMTPSKDSWPREYWAFRFGRLAVQLPRVIEQAYIHDSLPIDEPAVEDKADHPRDKFPSVDRVFADIEEALINLRDNGPSNLKTAAEDAFKAFDEFKRLILHALADGDAGVVANHFSFLQDECLPRRGQSFDDSVLREFLAKFRGDQKPTNPEKLGRGRPKKTISKEAESQFPLLSDAWNRFTKTIETVSKRLNKSVVLYNMGKALEEASNAQHLKSMTSRHDKSNNEFYRELSDVVEKQLELLASLGVETADLAWNVSSERDFGTRLRLTLEELEEQLVSFEWKNDPNAVAITEFRSMKSLSWDEVSISLEETDATTIDPCIVIEARCVSVKKRASELGFFTEHGRPATRLVTLAKFCRAEGFVTWPDTRANETVKKRLEDEENDLQVFQRTDEEDDREESGGDEDTLEGVEGDREPVSRARSKPPIEKHHAHLFRNHLKDLLGIDEDPFYPYDRPEGETVGRRSQLGKTLPPRQVKGYKLKCMCSYQRGPR
jgi:hypothetical protein